MDIKNLLERVKSGDISVEQAENMLRAEPFTDLGYAKVDLRRQALRGASEVIYGGSKTAEQITGIARTLIDNGQSPVLITRISPEKADAVRSELPLEYYDTARIGIIGGIPAPSAGTVAVVTGGTSDMPVAEEAALTAEFYGCRVDRVYDVGVSGLHRLLSCADVITAASVVIAIAGMEGALASVVGGMVACPVIAVPTSVGYGASFGGVAALLSMLNSCASGVSVVNIDNGFGAGYIAGRILNTNK